MQVNILEAKNRLSRLITNPCAPGRRSSSPIDGEPVARLVPVGTAARRIRYWPRRGHTRVGSTAIRCPPMRGVPPRKSDAAIRGREKEFVGLIYLDACLLIYLIERHRTLGRGRSPAPWRRPRRCGSASRHSSNANAWSGRSSGVIRFCIGAISNCLISSCTPCDARTGVPASPRSCAPGFGLRDAGRLAPRPVPQHHLLRGLVDE